MSTVIGESRTYVRKPDHERLRVSDRVGELVSILAMALVFSFFAYHQAAQTGFFTDAFGPTAMLFVYGPIMLSVVAPLIRSFSGRRNPARPMEAVTNLFSAVAAIWLLMVFPFTFAHLADALPTSLQFLLAWVTNDIGRIVLLLQAIICPLVALVTVWQYLVHRRR